ncbi:tyrosine-type recombinase/integrase [Danxiaibacter flavus]|uniref:Tyrosine recombinase XerC n=1 Tax=Danxiaibacter flavus TaxID=3049108 RepID=A0ABV3ZCT3_9BACT|nr:tyrosine-type recombinase/integrase [Chitinophagaceae bacterium DXS]
MYNSQYPQIQPFLQYLQFEKRYSQHTIISYQLDLDQFAAFLVSQFEAPSIKQVSSVMIRSWMGELKEEGLSAKTINRKISTLKSFFKYLQKQGEILQTPLATVITPKISKRLPSFVAEEDIDTLIRYVEFPDTWSGRTDRLILLLFYNTGMRLSELIQLKESQLDPSYSQVKVLGKGNKERIIPVQSELIKELALYTREKPERVEGVTNIFVSERGKPLYPKYVYNLVKKYLGAVTTIQKKSPHVLRHTFATHLMNNGADLNAVKELLGHSSLAATQVYTHNTIEKLKEAYRKAHPKA